MGSQKRENRKKEVEREIRIERSEDENWKTKMVSQKIEVENGKKESSGRLSKEVSWKWEERRGKKDMFLKHHSWL